MQLLLALTLFIQDHPSSGVWNRNAFLSCSYPSSLGDHRPWMAGQPFLNFSIAPYEERSHLGKLARSYTLIRTLEYPRSDPKKCCPPHFLVGELFDHTTVFSRNLFRSHKSVFGNCTEEYIRPDHMIYYLLTSRVRDMTYALNTSGNLPGITTLIMIISPEMAGFAPKHMAH